MGFTAPLGLLALLALPAIVFLHLFRRRFRERVVAGLFLFAPDALPSQAGRTRTRLLHTPSLWLELLAAACLALLLAGFHVGEPGRRAHLVVVLDDSASMAAQVRGSSAADRARDLVRRMLEDELDAAAVATVVLTAPRPEILIGPRSPKALVVAALDAWSPKRSGHDPAAALALGLDLADGPDAPVFVTDGEAPFVGERYRHVAVGRPTPNVALVAARRVTSDQTETVLVDVAGWAERALETSVRLDAVAGGEAREIDRREVRVIPGETVRFTFRLPSTEAGLRLALGEDALALDNEALLLPAPPRVVGTTWKLGPDLVSALRLERVLDAAGQVRVVEAAETAALAFRTPANEPTDSAIEVVVGPRGDARDVWIGPYLLERRRRPGGDDGRPWLEGVSLDGVVWSAGRSPAPGLPLVLAGEAVLVAEERAGDRIQLHLNLDPLRTNLASSPDWPVLVANVVEAARQRLPGAVATNVTVGDEMAWRIPGGGPAPDGLTLVDPDGAKRPARGSGVAAWEAHQAGLHRLVDRRGERARYAARFFDPSESNLRERKSFDRAPVSAANAAEETATPSGHREARILALLLLVLLVLDWWVLAAPGRRP